MKIRCDICNREFDLSPSYIDEKDLVVEKNLAEIPVTVTFLTCPHCNKQYPVIVDNEESKRLLEEQTQLYKKQLMFRKFKKSIPKKLADKYSKTVTALRSERHKIQEDLDGSFYQTDEGKEQLDYRYHVR